MEEVKMIIENAKYVTDEEGNKILVNAIIDGINSMVPLNSSNRHYAEILRQVEAGELSILEAN